ncbi:Rv1733c family protein [Yinghuangia sp. YIM S09857]|uniref:Rv1733c family protein n=1 Tax=Yinghuangia sp. YIM S09857 TaxID=3436929 RepID=UPI003F535246
MGATDDHRRNVPPHKPSAEPGASAPPLRGRRHQLHDVLLGFIVVALTAVPVLAFCFARAQYSRSVAEREAELAQRHPISATLAHKSSSPRGGSSLVDAPVSWTGPDGSVRTAIAPVRAPARGGETTTVWLDRSGMPVEPPAPASRAVLDTAAMTVTVLLCGGMAVLALYCAEQKLFMRSRLRAWDREWAQVGPLWTATP